MYNASRILSHSTHFVLYALFRPYPLSFEYLVSFGWWYHNLWAILFYLKIYNIDLYDLQIYRSTFKTFARAHTQSALINDTDKFMIKPIMIIYCLSIVVINLSVCWALFQMPFIIRFSVWIFEINTKYPAHWTHTYFVFLSLLSQLLFWRLLVHFHWSFVYVCLILSLDVSCTVIDIF